jgi:predicted ATP-grasp superfamily ATP-dependent carboligase
VLGLTRQLVGEPELGARDFQYCGSLLLRCAGPGFPCQDELFRRCRDLANVVAREFELVGLNGIDFIADQNIPYLIEVNPRFSASMELVQRAQGVSMFDVHFEACHGHLPLISPPTPNTYGKAIVFARRSVTVPPGSLWKAVDLADLPHPGERIEKGHPICTVFAEAQTPQRCRERLLERAAAVYRCVERRLKRAS